mgnify:CR=1 FL=1
MYIYYTIDTTATSSSNNNNVTGSVLWIEHLPHTSTLLVGYTHGTVALWDISKLTRLHNLPLYQYGPVLMAMKTQDSLSQAQHKQAKLSRFKRPLFGDTSLFSHLLNTTTAAITTTTGNGGSSTAVGILGGKDNTVATLPAAITTTHTTGTTSTTTTTSTTATAATATTDTTQPATSRSPSRTRLSSTATATSGTSTTDPSPIPATRKSLHTADGGEQNSGGEEYSR